MASSRSRDAPRGCDSSQLYETRISKLVEHLRIQVCPEHLTRIPWSSAGCPLWAASRAPSAVSTTATGMPRKPQPPLAGGAEDLHTWLEQVAAHQLASVSSKLGARALKQDAASRAAGSRSSPVLRPSASRPSTAGGQPSGEFYLYRGKLLPKGRWQHDPLRTEVSHWQHNNHTPPQPQRWSSAASAAELRYGHRWGEDGVAGSLGSGSTPHGHAQRRARRRRHHAARMLARTAHPRCRQRASRSRR